MRTMDPNKYVLVESFINTYKNERGKAPSGYEIADGTGLSKSTVSRYLQDMREKPMYETISFRFNPVEEYFPEGTTGKQMQEIIMGLFLLMP